MAWAGGFNLYEQGARATALGGAFTATADDASAIFYNPAGLGFLEGTVLDINWTPIISGSKFAGATPPTAAPTGETANQFFSIPGLYVSHTLPDHWGFGVGLYTPFGLGVEWKNPSTWVGRETSYDVDLATFYVTPAVAYKVDERLSLAVGADFSWQTIELNRFNAIPFGGNSDRLNVVDTKLQGTSDLNVTPSAGVLYQPTERWSFGVMYHHKKTFKFKDGDAKFNNIVPTDDPGLAALRDEVEAEIAALGGTDHKISGEINIPYILSLAARYRFHERATFEFDAVHWSWSDFDKIGLVYDNDPRSPLNETLREGYEDTWQLRFGVDVNLTTAWKGMLGYIYDKTPQPATSVGPMLADATRHDFSLGAQYQHKQWRFTGSYLVVNFNTRSTVENGQVTYFPGSTAEEIEARVREAGTYKSLAHLFSLGVGYNF